MTEAVLVLNVGSSSVKFSLHAHDGEAFWRGQVSGIGTPLGSFEGDQGQEPHDIPDQEAAIDLLWRHLDQHWPGLRLLAAGHRVVHGGRSFRGPVRLDAEILRALHRLEPLAPLHQSHCLAGIEAVSRRQADLPQVACFDTAFHLTRPELEQRLALPDDPRYAPLRAYGFHGLSYESIAARLPAYLGEVGEGRVIVAHLGNGSSLCALKARRSQATTMSFTPLDGLPMATRSGSLDPSVALYLQRQAGLDPDGVEDLLNHHSGLLGLSGLSGDLRLLQASDDPRADFAIDYLVHHTAKAIGTLAAVLGGLDGLVFTAGIGEHDAALRARIVDASAWLGLRLDAAANAANGPRISRLDSSPSAWVITTDEAAVIARHTLTLIGSPAPEEYAP